MTPKVLERVGFALGGVGLAGIIVGCAMVSLLLAVFVGSALLAGCGILVVAAAVRTEAVKKDDKP